MRSVIIEVWIQHRNKVGYGLQALEENTVLQKTQYVQGKGTLVLGSNIVHVHVQFL